MNEVSPTRGTKRTCLTCEAKFYDLGRVPMICPKCGAEFVEVVRPVSPPRQMRKRGYWGKDAPPVEAEESGAPATDEDSAGEEAEESDEDEEKDDDAEHSEE